MGDGGQAQPQRQADLVDPRFTRTSSTADLFLQIRAGTDIAFLGGLIKYALENNRIAKDYLLNYTNASFLIKDGFKLPEDGLYSGFDEATKTYDRVHLELPRKRRLREVPRRQQPGRRRGCRPMLPTI